MIFDYKKRIKGLRGELKKRALDSFLVTDEKNITYLSGFTGSDSVILITPDSQFFLTDSRYTEEAGDTVKGFAIVKVTSSTYNTLGSIIRNNRVKRIGFESANLPHEVFKRLTNYTGKAKLVPAVDVIENLRIVKDADEIKLIKKSISVTKDVLKKVTKEIRPRMSEVSLSDFIECEFIRQGARASFQTIVAAGNNCSKPHAHPTGAKISKNDFLMIDLGCSLNSYNSDMTRMVLIGRVKDEIRKIYAVVKTAQEKALEAIRPGIKISAVDSAGRSYIEKNGYGKFFGHSIGHGIGLDVHEGPTVSERNTGILKPGMVFTVEPAIYIPKFGGVRIEDMVRVTNTGCEILTR